MIFDQIKKKSIGILLQKSFFSFYTYCKKNDYYFKKNKVLNAFKISIIVCLIY